MKNFTLLLIGLVCLGVANAQNKSSEVLHTGKVLTDIPRQFFPDVTANRSGGSLRSVNPVYDSVYMWRFNRTTKKWDKYEKQFEFTYNTGNKNTGYVQQLWNDTFLIWQNSGQQVNTYTAFDSLANAITQFWISGAWVNSFNWLYTYDSNNNLVTETLQTWDTTKWVNNYQQIRGFNSKNLDTNILIRGYNGTVWDTTEQFIYTYNAANLDTGELTQLWKSGAWSNYSRITNKYTGNNVDTEITYNASGSLWVNSSLYTYTYNTNNSNTSFTNYIWSGGWVPISQYLYSYNAKNLDTNTITNLWSGSVWQLLSNETDAYYPNGIEQWASVHSYNTTVDTITNGDSTYWYINGAAGINRLAANAGQLSVYPNPSSDFIHADIQLQQPSSLQLRLVNMLGQTMWVTDAGTVSSYQNNISIANLTDGIYLLEMVTDDESETQKIIVTH